VLNPGAERHLGLALGQAHAKLGPSKDRSP
jgi:hypothetical protein